MMGHVLKASQVRLDEPVRLGIDGADAPQSAAGRPDARARVRMTHSDSSGAVLEIACSCGKIIHIRCEYAAAAPHDPRNRDQSAADAPARTPENDGERP